MIAYAARTENLRNLAALRARGWRILASADRPTYRPPPDFRYAVDNGAWHAHAAGTDFDEDAFLRIVERLGAGADFIVVPDIVLGGCKSLEFSLRWRDRLRPSPAPLLLAVQDGMTPEMVDAVLDGCGIFVGGSTDWKEATMPEWGALACEARCHLHVGRVNSVRRINLCEAAGAHSFDGSSVSRFAVNASKLDSARRQADMFSQRER